MHAVTPSAGLKAPEKLRMGDPEKVMFSYPALDARGSMPAAAGGEGGGGGGGAGGRGGGEFGGGDATVTWKSTCGWPRCGSALSNSRRHSCHVPAGGDTVIGVGGDKPAERGRDGRMRTPCRPARGRRGQSARRRGSDHGRVCTPA